jgi:uncharacterized protein (DUF488 family)
MTLYTIGFTGKSAERFFDILVTNAVRRVLDVRLNNTNQLAGFSKRDDLRFFLSRIANIGYMHLQQFAPSDALLKAYRSHKVDWDEYEHRYLALLSERDALGSVDSEIFENGCLLCSEASPDHCHRRLLAEYIAVCLPDVHVIHLP